MQFWAGLNQGAQNYQQGAANSQNIALRAQQIQQAQMALDQEKHKLAGQAAMFSGLPSGQGGPPPMQPPPQQQGPMAQPMPPGQSSAPAQPQGGMQAPPPQVAAGGPAVPPPGPQPGGGPGGDMSSVTDPQAPVKALFSIAQEIKARNPGINPQDLFQAVQQTVEMSKGLDPAMRQSMMLLAAQIRAQTSQQNNELNNQTKTKLGDQSDATKQRGQNMAAQTSLQRGQQAMERVQAVQSAMDKRFSTGQSTSAEKTAITERVRAITAQLTSATRQLSIMKDSLGQPLPDTDPRVKKANQDIAQASAQLDVLEKRLGGGQQAGSAAAGGGKPRYTVGHIIDQGGKKYRVTGGDPSDPDVVPVQ